MYVTDLAIALVAVAACAAFVAYAWNWPDAEIKALFMEVQDDGRE